MLEPKTNNVAAKSSQRRLFVRVLVWARRLIVRHLPEAEAREVRDHVDAEGKLSERYALMCALSAGIATLGLLQSSSAVVIGAMLVSPLMSPIAKLGLSFASLDGRRAQDAARVLAIGAGIGICLGMALTWLSPIRNATPEIIARTAPTLLDLAVAVLSGLAGGYATVHRRGETAIGVAIATAIMPPLATVGYGLAVGRLDFAGGALLLFLTNLAAIAFCFALVARLRGVERPAASVEFKRRYVVIGILAFLVLATPLAMTLRRVTQETRASLTARNQISVLLKIDQSQIAQLSVDWSNMSSPRISASAITPQFVSDAETQLRDSLSRTLKAKVDFHLQQIVATDPRAQTQALVDAALARSIPGTVGVPTAQEAPIDAIKTASRASIAQAWADPTKREVVILAAPRSDWSLGQYRAEEMRLSTLGFGWSPIIIPPFVDRIPITFGDNEVSVDTYQIAELETAVWALKRWGIGQVVVEGISGARTGSSRASTLLAESRAANIAVLLNARGVKSTSRLAPVRVTLMLSAEGPERVRSADILLFAAK